MRVETSAARVRGPDLPGGTRGLPAFIVIGAMRAGTTSLYAYFSQHPQVGSTLEKEPDYFIAAQYAKGLDWYKAQFQTGYEVLCDISPNYSKVNVFPGVPERIHALLPDVRLIYIVRDPVKRFVSQYKHMLARGFSLPEPQAMCAVEGDLPGPEVRLGLDQPYHHILSASAYARQLKAYLPYFAMDRILIVDFEELRRDEAAQLKRIRRFLGLGCVGPSHLPRFNSTAELSRLPAPVLRYARDSRLGGWVRRRMSLGARDRVKKLLAAPFRPQDRQFAPESLARIETDLAEDIAEFRELTGMDFDTWSI